MILQSIQNYVLDSSFDEPNLDSSTPWGPWPAFVSGTYGFRKTDPKLVLMTGLIPYSPEITAVPSVINSGGEERADRNIDGGRGRRGGQPAIKRVLRPFIAIVNRGN